MIHVPCCCLHVIFLLLFFSFFSPLLTYCPLRYSPHTFIFLLCSNLPYLVFIHARSVSVFSSPFSFLSSPLPSASHSLHMFPFLRIPVFLILSSATRILLVFFFSSFSLLLVFSVWLRVIHLLSCLKLVRILMSICLRLSLSVSVYLCLLFSPSVCLFALLVLLCPPVCLSVCLPVCPRSLYIGTSMQHDSQGKEEAENITRITFSASITAPPPTTSTSPPPRPSPPPSSPYSPPSVTVTHHNALSSQVHTTTITTALPLPVITIHHRTASISSSPHHHHHLAFPITHPRHITTSTPILSHRPHHHYIITTHVITTEIRE